jgi:acetoacetyl-CoA synthetase
MESVPHTAEPLWHPHAEQIRNSNLARFRQWLRENRSLDFDDSQSLFQWSVGDLEAFWGAISEYFDVRFTTAPEAVLRRDPDPVNTKWFPGARLNYAEYLLRFGSSTIGVGDDRPAILFCAEPDIPGVCQVLTRAELVDRVNRVATAMRRLGVQQGDRVAGYLPNRVETAIAFRGYFAEIRN